MNRIVLAVLAVLAAAALAAAAHAETVRSPETGDPAFVIEIPDGWTHTVDGEGSLVALSANHAAKLTFTITPYDGALDALAADSLDSSNGTPLKNTGTAEISGYAGSTYDGTLVNGDVHAKVHLVAVKLDDDHVAAITLLTADNLDAPQTDTANTVLKSATLTKVKAETPPPPATPEAAPAPPAPATPATSATPEPAPPPKP